MAGGDRADRRTEQAHLAADLAAKAVANLIFAPDLGQNEVGQILREYLGGLIEDGPLKRIFYTWATHRSGAVRPDATRAVVPNPHRLRTSDNSYELHIQDEISPSGVACGLHYPSTAHFVNALVSMRKCVDLSGRFG